MSSEDLQRPGMVHRARDACDLEVAPVDNDPSLRVRYPVEPDHGAVNLVQGVGTESVMQALAKEGLHRLEQASELAGLGAVKGNRRDQLSGHSTEPIDGCRPGCVQGLIWSSSARAMSRLSATPCLASRANSGSPPAARARTRAAWAPTRARSTSRKSTMVPDQPYSARNRRSRRGRELKSVKPSRTATCRACSGTQPNAANATSHSGSTGPAMSQSMKPASRPARQTAL